MAEGDGADDLLSAHPDPVVQYGKGAEGIVVEAINSAFRETFAVDGAEVSLQATLSAEDALSAVAGAIQSGDALDRETVCDTTDGDRRFRLRNVPTDDGGYLLYTALGDGHERQAKLQAEVDRLEDRNERLETFASVVSHDLRNPLEVAETYLESARETGEDEQFDRVGQALDRMRTLIEDVLELAREGRAIDERERSTLEPVATAAWETVDGGAATLTVENGAATLRTDPDRLQQALANLFRNSLEHGGTDVAIRVGALGNADGTGFFVEDDGSGIPEDEREDVFEPGVTTDQDGTGLGLAIVERVVDAHGWTIAVTESDTGGARFEIRGVESLQPL
ncbi:sensor histidine kinase [Halorientalis pallida]|uniref:histidine kinase n=1 Tax=Halorientalis pallida TaxID=2479928 RepID=A0A498L1A2_9EURY|nr:HAMP domain-containing sensor histidine kinase [Halorientalis pallida]RXK51756.1 HAMP domain-containing histidine kinase [Halorientalis pallida]